MTLAPAILALATGLILLLLGCGQARAAALAGVLALLALRVTWAMTAGLGDRLPSVKAGEDQVVVGTLCEFPRHDPGFSRFVLETDQVSRGAGLPRRVLVTWYRPGDLPAIGERWRVTVRLRPPRGTANPGGFDLGSWALARGIGATGYVRDWPLPARLGDGDCRLGRWRGRVAAAMAAAVGEGPSLPYLLGLSVGAYQALPSAEWAALRITGTIHLISISGFHVALVAAPFLGLGVLAGRWLLRHGLGGLPARCLGIGTALGAAIAYGGLAGYAVPTLRSILMLAVVAVLLWSREPPDAGRVLGGAAVVLVLLEPLGFLQPGFWLSFGGVVLLVLGARLAPGVPGGRPGQGPPAVAGAFLRLQGVMAAGLAPLQLAFFGQMPLLAGLANLVAIPVFSLVLLPLILLGAALVLPWPGAGGLLLRGAAAAVDLWRQVNGSFASLPMASLAGQASGLPAYGLAALSLAGFLAPRPWPWRWAFLPLLLPLLAGQADRPGPGALEVRVLDVGQGTAVLLRTRRHSLLYDTGPGHGGEGAALVSLLAAAGAGRLDSLVVSHADLDHAGGATAVMAAHPRAVLWSSGFRLPGHPVRFCGPGADWWWDGHHFEFLHPAAARSDPGNDDSCVLRVRGPGGRVLLTGDIGRGVERELVDAGHAGPVDLVVVAHHGSRSSSDPVFIAATAARYAVISAGFGNRWGFPVPEVLRRWREAGACVISTATGGSLLFSGAPGRPFTLVARERPDRPWPWVRGPASCPPPPTAATSQIKALAGV